MTRVDEAKRLQGLAQTVLTSYFKSPHLKVEVYLIDKRKMRELNRVFRGVDKPTDILSFESPSGFPQLSKTEKAVGQIYLCPTYIKSHTVGIERLVVHGLLHLLGFDHDKEHARIRMQNLEFKILAWLKNRS
ncbi:MAG: rRNA maturation RNase YbeY [Patescibacteria group bacterium]|nr:rRNA maturation RNase YbeY [Patescibacteria group bacterium]MCL5224360.1 rRNA maturation RNase YbeY [Patescibacteria group bacterium]